MKKQLAIGLNEVNSGGSYAVSLKAYQENVTLVLKLAKKHYVPVITNPQLIEILEMLPVNQAIPKELLPALQLILDRLDSGS